MSAPALPPPGKGPSGRAPEPGERIRFCLQCGDVLPFSVERCPACGARADDAETERRGDRIEPGDSIEAGDSGPAHTLAGRLDVGSRARRDCPGCGASILASLLFCPRCGGELGLTSAGRRATPVATAVPSPPEGPVETFSVALALAAPALVLLALAEILVSASRA
jgi:hypothetical protein